jgi:hypothetical protein
LVLAERLADERLTALAHSTAVPGGTPRVLFVCTGNAGRSQPTAALLAHADEIAHRVTGLVAEHAPATS